MSDVESAREHAQWAAMFLELMDGKHLDKYTDSCALHVIAIALTSIALSISEPVHTDPVGQAVPDMASRLDEGMTAVEDIRTILLARGEDDVVDAEVHIPDGVVFDGDRWVCTCPCHTPGTVRTCDCLPFGRATCAETRIRRFEEESL